MPTYLIETMKRLPTGPLPRRDLALSMLCSGCHFAAGLLLERAPNLPAVLRLPEDDG